MKSKKREINIRPRLRDKELLEYLNNHNFQTLHYKGPGTD